LDRWLKPVYPSPEEIRKDLAMIKAAGFSGVLTTSSDKGMMVVPHLAQDMGLHVIMGVWSTDHAELERAVHARRFVDAYSVGNAQVLEGFPIETLEAAVDYVKRRTHRPVAVSDLPNRYGPRLAALGDWLFPDAHLTLRDRPDIFPRVDLDRDVELFMKSTQAMAAQARTLDRPLVFKNVAYPYDGLASASRAAQAEFYRRILYHLNDAQQGHVTRASIIAQGAFDAPWKLGVPFEPWDPFTGLLIPDQSGRAVSAPAVRELLRRYPWLTPTISPADQSDDAK
jgi:hypothetical protein